VNPQFDFFATLGLDLGGREREALGRDMNDAGAALLLTCDDTGYGHAQAGKRCQEHSDCHFETPLPAQDDRVSSLATTINAELAEPAEKTGSVLRVLRFLR
jgi:hypothetical protein